MHDFISATFVSVLKANPLLNEQKFLDLIKGVHYLNTDAQVSVSTYGPDGELCFHHSEIGKQFQNANFLIQVREAAAIALLKHEENHSLNLKQVAICGGDHFQENAE